MNIYFESLFKKAALLLFFVITGCNSDGAYEPTAVPESLKVTPVNESFPIGLSKSFTAVLIMDDGTAVDVTKDEALSWTSSETSVATIDNATGIATGHSVGTTIITASVEVNGVLFTDSTTLMVTDAVPKYLQLTPLDEIVGVGLSKQFIAKLAFSDGSVFDVTKEKSLLWESSDDGVATIDSIKGRAKGVAIGEATITASISINGVSLEESTKLTVSAPIPESFKLTTLDESVANGFSKQFIAVMSLTDGSVVDVTEDELVMWKSSDKHVASIDRIKGLATANKVGITTITASFAVDGGTWKESTTLAVTDAVPVSLEVDWVPETPEVTPIDDILISGHTRQFYAKVTFSDNSIMNVIRHRLLTWTESDGDVLSIDASSGKVTGHEKGNSTIYGTLLFDGETFEDSEDILVKTLAEDYLDLFETNNESSNRKVFTNSPSNAFSYVTNESTQEVSETGENGPDGIFLKFSYADAYEMCEHYKVLQIGGRSNWRLPTRAELEDELYYTYYDMYKERNWPTSVRYWAKELTDSGNGVTIGLGPTFENQLIMLEHLQSARAYVSCVSDATLTVPLP